LTRLEEIPTMEDNRSLRRNYFLTLAVVFIAVAFTLVFALCAAINRWLFAHGASMGVAGDVIAIWVPIAVGVFVPIPLAIYYARRPAQRPNHPRIEHLRIAGKYAPTSAAKMGVSPLYLTEASHK
jgi:hypothetical protein